MFSIKENISHLKKMIPKRVELVAISKTKPINKLLEVYHLGQKVLGENKVQEMVEKWKNMPKDIQWHMVGHLQTNKVKYITPFVSLIHSVDSIKLLKEIQKQGAKSGLVLSCLLQIYIAEETNKFGFNVKTAEEILAQQNNFPNVLIKGFMGMATFTKDEKKIRKEFSFLYQFFVEQQKKYSNLKILSMGMSDDFHWAIEEGSNMVRIGSKIFGSR